MKTASKSRKPDWTKSCGFGCLIGSGMPKKNEIIIEDSITKIKLDDNSFCLVDTEDYLLFSNHFWRKNKNGYVESSIGLIHRVVTKCPNNKVVDHINHNTLDNRKENLRICTHTENNFNRVAANRTTSTGVRGVFYDARSNKYRVEFTFNHEHYDFGLFDDLETAKNTVQNARWNISHFSEMDNPCLSDEFIKQKELREKLQKYYRKEKIDLPKWSMYCCGHTYFISNANDFKNFRCYLHKPPYGKYSHCLTYRFVCPVCNCIKTITYFYSKDMKILRTHLTKKTLNAINYLKRIQEELLIKEMNLLDLLKFSYCAKTKGSSNWYYGVAINDKLFKKVSFNNENVGVVPVRTGDECFSAMAQ